MTAARREELLAEFYPPIQHGYVRAREIACEALASDAARAEQIERLREALSRHGQHGMKCPARRSRMNNPATGVCDCGLEAILSSTDPSRGGE
jgi:hypothetical protein